jgi:hypothetical protein
MRPSLEKGKYIPSFLVLAFEIGFVLALLGLNWVCFLLNKRFQVKNEENWVCFA